MTATSLITFVFAMAIRNHVPKAIGAAAPLRTKAALKPARG